jgi:hypothetical protein
MSDTTIDGEAVTRTPRLDFNRDALASGGAADAPAGSDPAVSVGVPATPGSIPGMPTIEDAAADGGTQQQQRQQDSELAGSAAALRQAEEQAALLRTTSARLAALEAQQRQQGQLRAQSYQQDVTRHRDSAAADAERHWSSVEAARETGDTKAERLALTNYQRAVAKHDQAAGELDRLARGGPVPGASAATEQMHPTVQAWVDSHPRYHTDNAYRAAAQAAAFEAEQLGFAPGDSRYTAHVDTVLKARGFDGNGNGDGQQRANGGGVNGNRQQSGGGAPPAGRGTGGGVAAKTVTTPLGKFTYRDGRDQQGRPHRFINFPDKQTADDFKEWAEVNKCTVEEYANEFVKIAAERAEGGEIGLQIGGEVVLR